MSKERRLILAELAAVLATDAEDARENAAELVGAAAKLLAAAEVHVQGERGRREHQERPKVIPAGSPKLQPILTHSLNKWIRQYLPGSKFKIQKKRFKEFLAKCPQPGILIRRGPRSDDYSFEKAPLTFEALEEDGISHTSHQSLLENFCSWWEAVEAKRKQVRARKGGEATAAKSRSRTAEG